MSSFNINGLLTIHGEATYDFIEKHHTHTDWEVYVDNDLTMSSYNDAVNLRCWDKAIIGNNGKPYDGTNGNLTCKVRVKIDKEWSGYKWLICVVDLNTFNDVLRYGILTDVSPRKIHFGNGKPVLDILNNVSIYLTDREFPLEDPNDIRIKEFVDTIQYCVDNEVATRGTHIINKGIGKIYTNSEVTDTVNNNLSIEKIDKLLDNKPD